MSFWLVCGWAHQDCPLQTRGQLAIPVHSPRRLLLISDNANGQGFFCLFWPKSSTPPAVKLLVILGLPVPLRTTRQTVVRGGTGVGPPWRTSAPTQSSSVSRISAARQESLVSSQGRGMAVLIFVSGYGSFWGEGVKTPHWKPRI